MAQKLFTVKEFAKKSGTTEEYIRQACRGYIDTKGTKTKLPHGYKARKIANQWFVEPERWFLDYMPFPLEGLPLPDFHNDFLDLKILNHKTLKQPVYLMNLFDYYGSSNGPGVYFDISGDYLLYLVYKFLEKDFIPKMKDFKDGYLITNMQAVNSIFIQNLDLLAAWLLEAGKPLYFNRNLHEAKPEHCLFVWSKIKEYEQEKYIL